jgi:hypothetical protein
MYFREVEIKMIDTFTVCSTRYHVPQHTYKLF